MSPLALVSFSLPTPNVGSTRPGDGKKPFGADSIRVTANTQIRVLSMRVATGVGVGECIVAGLSSCGGAFQLARDAAAHRYGKSQVSWCLYTMCDYET